MHTITVDMDETVHRQLLIEADASQNMERCGLLLGATMHRIDEIKICTNVSKNPERHFEIPPENLIAAEKEMRRGGRHLLGYYHSHPAGDASPSQTDARLSACDGRIWAIIARNTVRLWRNVRGGDVHDAFTEIQHRVTRTATNET